MAHVIEVSLFMHQKEHRVALERIDPSLSEAIRQAWAQTGLLTRINGSTRIALKPNFTYPCYKPSVTTSPAVIREAVRILRDITTHIAIVETDGGYGAWKVAEAFK